MARWVVVLSLVVGCAACSDRRPKYSAEEWQHIRGHQKAGDRAFEAGRLDEAAEHYDVLIENYPSVVDAVTLTRRAAIYFLERDYEAGIDFVDRVALPLAKEDLQIYEQRALMLWAMKRPEEAIADAERVVAERPTSYQAQLLIGTYYFGRDPARAVAAFDAYLTHRPGSLAKHDGEPRLKLGLAYLATGDPERAETQFELVRARFPDDRRLTVNADNGLCAAYVAVDEFDRAIEVCGRLTSNARHLDRKGSAFYNLAQAYMYAERPADALAAARKYMEYNPRSAKAWMLIAQANLGVADCDEAERALDKAVELGASDVEWRKRVHTCRAAQTAP